MKRTVLLILATIVTLVVSTAEGKSTMEKLINKEWHEFDFKTMKAKETYYEKYTGTQRLIVSADEEGNTKMRVQKYYLSYKWEERFDTTKVGKNRNGKYIILQGAKNETGGYNVICYEIAELSDVQLQTKNVSIQSMPQKFYVTVEDDGKMKKQGKFQSTIDLLADKVWYLLDENNKRTGMEWTFGYSAYFKCKMPKDRRAEFPKWERREFYLSNEIVTKFDRSKVCESMNGIYLVVNDLEEDGEWQTRTYDIKTLSANRLMLECLYPRGEGLLVFENQYSPLEEKLVKMKPKQKDLMGKDWYRVDTATWRRSKYVENFNETHVTRSFPTRKNGELVDEKKTFEYYMSNQPVDKFDWSQKGKNPEGDYIVVNEPDANGNYRAVNYQIMSLEGRNMFSINVSHPDSVLHVYERDKTLEEQNRMNPLIADSLMGEESMMSKIVGKQWYLRLNNGLKSLIYPQYFTRTTFAVPVWYEIRNGYGVELEMGEWALSDGPRSMEPGTPNGKYLILYTKNPKRYYKNRQNWLNKNASRGRMYRNTSAPSSVFDYSYKVLYLSEYLMVLEPVSDVGRRVVFMSE